MKKLHDWELWDWKSIIYGILILGGLFLLIFCTEFLPQFFRCNHSKEYTNTTEAYFIRSHRISGMTQNRSGSHEITYGVEFTYSYKVNKKIFIGKDIIPNTANYQRFLWNFTSTFIIKYDPNHPSESQIKTDNY